MAANCCGVSARNYCSSPRWTRTHASRCSTTWSRAAPTRWTNCPTPSPAGRDHLLELASRRGGGDGDALQAALAEDDAEQAHEDYPLRLLEAFGIHSEPLGPQLWLLDPEYIAVEGFEELKGGPRTATFDRTTALARDDLLYLRADHPMLLSAQELLLSGETGNVTFLVDDSLPPRTAVLEAVFVLECVAPRRSTSNASCRRCRCRSRWTRSLQCARLRAERTRRCVRAGDRQYDISPMRKVLAGAGAARCSSVRAPKAPNSARARASAALVAADAACSTPNCAASRRSPASTPRCAWTKSRGCATSASACVNCVPLARPRLDALRLVASPDFLSLRKS
jgi:ATP-dependent helicase HepA